MTTSESQRVVGKESCPDCGSRDNLVRYADGGAYCFTPGCGRHERGDGSTSQPTERRVTFDAMTGEVKALPRRSISFETAEKFGYQCGRASSGEAVQIAPYYAGNRLVAQKVRTADKRFWVNGDIDAAGLFGQHLWPSTGKRVVITEGEIDAMSVAQAFGLSWPVVSVKRGGGSAKKDVAQALQWLEGYDEIVVWFDNDEPGKIAADEVVKLFTPGKAKLAFAPEGYKDASDLLQAGELKLLSRCVYDAKVYRPEGVVTLKDVRERALATVKIGRPFPWPTITKDTFGRRPGEVIAVGGGSGCGKTDVFTEIITHDALELGVKCGVLYLEQNVAETAKRLAGKLAGKRFHIPDGSWTQEELVEAYNRLEVSENIHLFDAFGANSWEVLKPILRFMVLGLGCQHVFLDHLTALAAAEEDERKALEKIMAELAGFAQETGCILHFVSHLATPEGKPHEEGGRVMAKHFKGSRAIIYWSHWMFGIERDTQEKDEEKRSLSVIRCLKDRYTGNANGKTWLMHFDRDTGRLTESDQTQGFNDTTERDF